MSPLSSARRRLLFRSYASCLSPRCTFATWRPVQTLQDATVETFRKAAYSPSWPARLPERSFEDLPASAKWFQEQGSSFNTSYLGQFGDHMVPMELTRPTSSPDGEAMFERAEAPFRIFLGWAEQASTDSPRRLYVAQASLNRLPKPLQEDLPTPQLVATAGKGDLYDASIWLGVAPTYTPLHRDPNPNLYLQLAGRKAVRLLDPDVGRSVFAKVQAALGSTASSKFRGDEMMKGREKALLEAGIWSGETSDHEKEVVGYEAALSAGDSLFIPQGWWHSVKSIGRGSTGSVRQTKNPKEDSGHANDIERSIGGFGRKWKSSSCHHEEGGIRCI
ncbi:MAG: hypothetical protein Q9166_000389 [cf. Caloplaca sp. 2 TL-2023]